jgi:hypothetical protein
MCGKPVSLETCKIDEHGNAVHEECYAERIKKNGELARGKKDAKYGFET